MTESNSTKKRPTAVLVGVQLPGTDDVEHKASLAELGRLVHTLGYQVVATVSQKRSSPLAATVIGEGKLRELAALTGGSGEVESKVPTYRRKNRNEQDHDELTAAELAAEADAILAQEAADDHADESESEEHNLTEPAEIVVFDHELTPNQLRNLETATGVEVLDRTGVIVEIFHRHAHTREARIQVEIARLGYMATRLRVTKARGNREGGVGAGETAHELDKRRIRDRIAELTAELEDIHRNQQGRRDRRKDQAKIALVGYTNAGKSSLMRALTGSEVLVEDKLFATLDTTIRVMQPETKPRILVSDTVGFIKKLPHDLVASFRSTLDEARDASLLLFVVDGSDPTFRSQLAVTKGVLAELGADGAPSLLVLNKTDQMDSTTQAGLRREFPEAVQISTRRPEDIQRLQQLILAFFERSMSDEELTVPYSRGDVVSEIRRTMRVLAESHDEIGTQLKVRGYADDLARIRKLLQGR